MHSFSAKACRGLFSRFSETTLNRCFPQNDTVFQYSVRVDAYCWSHSSSLKMEPVSRTCDLSRLELPSVRPFLVFRALYVFFGDGALKTFPSATRLISTSSSSVFISLLMLGIESTGIKSSELLLECDGVLGFWMASIWSVFSFEVVGSLAKLETAEADWIVDSSVTMIWSDFRIC